MDLPEFENLKNCILTYKYKNWYAHYFIIKPNMFTIFLKEINIDKSTLKPNLTDNLKYSSSYNIIFTKDTYETLKHRLVDYRKINIVNSKHLFKNIINDKRRNLPIDARKSYVFLEKQLIFMDKLNKI